MWYLTAWAQLFKTNDVVSQRFLKIYIEWYANVLIFFAEKMWVAKATHIFSAKNIKILYIESAKTVNEMTLKELIKLMTLWTIGPCKISVSLSFLKWNDFLSFLWIYVANINSEIL